MTSRYCLTKRRTVNENTRTHTECNFKADESLGGLIFLVPVRVVDELPVQILGFLGVELLAAVWALERALHADAHVLDRSVTTLCCFRDLLRHGCRKPHKQN